MYAIWEIWCLCLLSWIGTETNYGHSKFAKTDRSFKSYLSPWFIYLHHFILQWLRKLRVLKFLLRQMWLWWRPLQDSLQSQAPSPFSPDPRDSRCSSSSILPALESSLQLCGFLGSLLSDSWSYSLEHWRTMAANTGSKYTCVLHQMTISCTDIWIYQVCKLGND